jgi:hypothetical protein
VLDIYSKKKLWEAEKRPRRIHPGIFIIVHIFLGLEKCAIGDAIILMGAKFTGIRLNKFYIYILDALKKLPLNMVLVKNIQASFVLVNFITSISLRKIRLVTG